MYKTYDKMSRSVKPDGQLWLHQGSRRTKKAGNAARCNMH